MMPILQLAPFHCRHICYWTSSSCCFGITVVFSELKHTRIEEITLRYAAADAEPLFDTPLGAARVLQATLDAHGDALDAMAIPAPAPAPYTYLGEDLGQPPAGASQDDVKTLGSLLRWATGSDAGDPVAALVRLRVLLPQLSPAPVLFAVDGYNALFAKTGYTINRSAPPPPSIAAAARGAVPPTSSQTRKRGEEELDEKRTDPLWAGQCRAAGALRLAHASGPPPHAAATTAAAAAAPCVFHLATWSETAPCTSKQSDALALQGMAKQVGHACVPRWTPAEASAFLARYRSLGILDALPSDALAAEWTFMAGGTGNGLRELAETF